MKILLAYGSAMSRIDDMKLLGGVSGGRTGQEILGVFSDINEHGLPRVGVKVGKDEDWLFSTFAIRALTNSWCLSKHSGYRSVRFGEDGKSYGHENVPRYTFKTWEEYRDLLYSQCEGWKPDIVFCATAVSNFTPTYVVENRGAEWPVPHVPCVKGKVDSRKTKSLLVNLELTPNIIGGVRHRIGQDAVLVGFKLTSHGNVDQLIEHAKHVMKEARCDLVIANDLQLGLGRKFFVTPTGWWEGTTDEIALAAIRIAKAKQSGFYRSLCRADVEPRHKDIETKTPGTDEAYTTANALWEQLKDQMIPHGCLAVRIAGGGFITTTRGKEDLYTGVQYTPRTFGLGVLTAVWNVDHEKRTVLVGHHQFSQEKATLNAPLLDKMFKMHPDMKVIIHLHRYMRDVLTADYTPPGTVAEVNLSHPVARAFNIKGHGSVIGFPTTDVGKILAFLEDETEWV